jgi:hypothetical protein
MAIPLIVDCMVADIRTHRHREHNERAFRKSTNYRLQHQLSIFRLFDRDRSQT